MDEECAIAFRLLIHSVLGDVAHDGVLWDAGPSRVPDCPLPPGLGLPSSLAGEFSGMVRCGCAMVAARGRMRHNGAAFDGWDGIEMTP